MKRLATRVAGEDLDPRDRGLFFGEHTLERDFFEVAESNAAAVLKALGHYTWGPQRAHELEIATADGHLDGDRLMVFVDAVGKGRFAQRLAGDVLELTPPAYVRDALDHLRKQ